MVTLITPPSSPRTGREMTPCSGLETPKMYHNNNQCLQNILGFRETFLTDPQHSPGMRSFGIISIYRPQK